MRQRAHLVALGDHRVADLHHEPVDQRRRGALEVRGRVAGVRGEALDGRALPRAAAGRARARTAGSRASTGRRRSSGSSGGRRSGCRRRSRGPVLWAVLDSVTTRASSRPSISGSSRLVSAKWPRWLVPNWSSKPSAVWRRGGAITPALLISRSRPSWLAAKRSANDRTEARLARSSSSSSGLGPVAAAATSAWAALPLSRLRQAMHHERAVARELARRDEPEAAVRAGDDGDAAGLVGDVPGVPAALRTLVDGDARAWPGRRRSSRPCRTRSACVATSVQSPAPDVLVLRDPAEREAAVVA